MKTNLGKEVVVVLADFHYCCIRVLAEKAGFSADDAQIIAYASQYTDDATEHKKFKIDKMPKEAAALKKDGKFDPICTAYKGINLALAALIPDVQRKVFIPFHFAPNQKYQGRGNYDYKVYPLAKLARKMLEEAAKVLKKGKNKLLGLIKLGIALHTFSDSYAHENFSGKRSSEDNDIEHLYIKENGRWKKLSVLEQLAHNMMPDIGHAEAKSFPDLSHLVWRYTHASTKQVRTRPNPGIFVAAALEIFRILCEINQTGVYEESLFEKIQECFKKTDSPEKKFELWRKAFPEIKFDYDLYAWRKEALDGDVEWDNLLTQEDYDFRFFKWKGDLKFFYFHLAAARQREFILSCIKNF